MEKQFPKNVRQIGNVCDEPKIYVEDYVDTYLNQLRQKALDNPAGAVLVGERHEQEGQEVVYILGALQMKELEVNGNDILIREDIWEYIEEEKKEYFPSQEIVGWCLIETGHPMGLNKGVSRIHMKHFAKDNSVFIWKDALEAEEIFYAYKYGELMQMGGHYIYYEKNPQMQAYMLEKNPELNQPEQELVADDAVKTFRKIIQKKHTEETQETEERASVFSYAATACLVLAVLTVGVQFYQNYNHKSITDTITETVSRTANSTEVTKAERQTEKKSVTPTSALKKDLTPIPVSPAATETPPVTSMAAEDDAETDTKNVLNSEKEQEIYREESDTRKAERRVKQEQVENNAAKNKISEDVTDSAVASSAESGTSYVIKPGDTLYQISISRYGTMEKVADICRANGLTEEEIIYPGQIIVLP